MSAASVDAALGTRNKPTAATLVAALNGAANTVGTSTNDTPGIRAVPLGLGLKEKERNGMASQPRVAPRLATLALAPPWALIATSLRDGTMMFVVSIPTNDRYSERPSPGRIGPANSHRRHPTYRSSRCPQRASVAPPTRPNVCPQARRSHPSCTHGYADIPLMRLALHQSSVPVSRTCRKSQELSVLEHSIKRAFLERGSKRRE